jgi:hypothetical protein
MMDPAELELQTAATRAFILADPEDLVLLRKTKTPDGAGGFVGTAEASLATQVARLIPQFDAVPELTGSDGRLAVPEWVLLMEPGSDIQRYDRFWWNDIQWEIAQLHYKPDYEVKGDVIRCA